MKKTTVTGLEEKWEVLLVYFVSLLGFIFSFLKYDYLSENIKFHYRQAGTIWLIYAVMSAASFILGNVVGFSIVSYIFRCITVILYIFRIITVVKSFENTRYEIPVVADLSKKIYNE